MTREALRPLAVAVCLTVAAGGLAAQEEKFFETVEVNVVNIEVIVTDAGGNPVTGLSRDDFEVYEDGRRVELSNFFAVEGRELVAAAAGEGEGEVAPPAAEGIAGPETKCLHLVIFIDNRNIWPQNRELLFENLREYLRERLDPRDRVMVASYSDRVEIVQPFTGDEQALYGALDRLETEAGQHVVLDSERRMWIRQVRGASIRTFNPPPGTGRDPMFEMAVAAAVEHSRSLRSVAERRVGKVRATVTALRAFCESLAGISGRKALVYVSDGLPVRPADSLVQEFSDRFERWMMANEQHIPSRDYRELERTIVSLNSVEFDVSQPFRELVEVASSVRIAFYPISSGGRGGYTGADVAGGASTTGVRMEQMTLRSSLFDMAEGTGGLAFTDTPNLSALLDRVVDDFTSFYSLGYPSPRTDTGEFHKIEVKVRGKEVTVRHLRGYREKTATSRLGELAVGAAVQEGIGENPLGVSIETGEPVASKRRKFRVPVTIKIPFRKLVLVPQEGFHSGRLTLSITVVEEGTINASSPDPIELPIRVPDDKIREAMGQVVTYAVELEMKQGNKRISVGVHDHFGQADSTVSTEFSVGE